MANRFIRSDARKFCNSDKMHINEVEDADKTLLAGIATDVVV